MDLSNSVSLTFDPPLPKRDLLFKKTGKVDATLLGYKIYADAWKLKVTAPNNDILVERVSMAVPFTNLQLALEIIEKHNPAALPEGKLTWVSSLEKVVKAEEDEFINPWLYNEPITVTH